MADQDFIRTLAMESWSLYGVGMVLIACRLVSRRMNLGGWSRLQLDDWLMVFASVTFTASMASINEIAKNGSSYMSPEYAASLSPDQVAMAVYGSKMTLALELFTLTTLWIVKLCLLILYNRLTFAFERHYTAVKLIAVYCVAGYVLVIALLLTYWCAPISEYWRVPVKYSQCATYYNHMIFASALNISSDLMLLCIPIPIIVQSKLPLKRKIVLCCLLGLGALNILIAVLNRYYNFANPDDLGYVYFYAAEVATAVYVGNVPLCWQLIRRIFHVGTWAGFENIEEQSPDMRGDPLKRHRVQHPTLPSSLFSTTTSTTCTSFC